VVSGLPGSARHEVSGSAAEPDALDGWSNLDLPVHLGDVDNSVELFADLDVWALSEEVTAGQQVLRAVLWDGRRVDLVVEGGLVRLPDRAADNDIRTVARMCHHKTWSRGAKSPAMKTRPPHYVNGGTRPEQRDHKLGPRRKRDLLHLVVGPTHQWPYI